MPGCLDCGGIRWMRGRASAALKGLERGRAEARVARRRARRRRPMSVTWNWKHDVEAVALYRMMLAARRRMSALTTVLGITRAKSIMKAIANCAKERVEARRLWKERVKWVVLNGASSRGSGVAARSRVQGNAGRRAARDSQRVTRESWARECAEAEIMKIAKRGPRGSMLVDVGRVSRRGSRGQGRGVG